MKRIILILPLIALFFISTGFWGRKKPVSNLPVAKQATLIEVTSPSEVMIKAAGIGSGSRKYRVPNAVKDAEKSAVYFLLYQATDPILNEADAKNKFSAIAESFFDIKNISRYIAWEEQGLSSRIAVSKKEIKIEKTMRINKKLLVSDLEDKGIIKKREQIAEQLSLPSIMVIPVAEEGANPLQVLKNNSLAATVAGVIESYLTSRKYDVIVPEATAHINNMTNALSAIKGMNDMAYQMALSFGSDIFITFQGDVNSRNVGSTKVSKASVVVKAYESTTGKLLGTETGYSEERPSSSSNALLEEAANNAVENVLSRILAYWKQDLKRGTQYKVVVKFSPQFKGDALENIQFEVEDAIKKVTDKYKLNTMTDQTADYLLWVNVEDMNNSREIYRTIKEDVTDASVRRIILNRKFIMLEVKPAL